MIDVKHTKCEQDGCSTHANFNNRGETRGLFCAKHKEPGMIDIKHQTCEHEYCETRPNYNTRGETKGRFCVLHKQYGMIDVMNSICKTSFCGTIVTKKYRGYCLRCFVHTFPGEKVSRNYKTKETAVYDFLNENFGNKYTIRWDKKVDGGCSLRRPDFIIDFGDWVLVIEVDENKHESYDCSCQNRRLAELSKDIGHRSMVMIRLNPDGYINSKNEKVASCWGHDGLGMAIVKKTQQKQWEHRLECLKQRIEYWVANPSDKMIQVDPMFYDGC